MAKNKAELQREATRYRAALSAMRTAHKQGEVLKAIKVAINACGYIDGMMQFEKRFEKRPERETVETLDYIFKYAPLVFDRASLETIADLLKEQKRIDRIATDDLATDLAQAIELMWDAHRLWKVVKATPGVLQDELRSRLSGRQERWQAIVEAWEDLNIVQRTPSSSSYPISVITNLAHEVRGKCSLCGATGKASIRTFLDDITCPKCNEKTSYVMLPSWDAGEALAK